MLEALQAFAPGTATCSMVVREETPFVAGGRLATVTTLEIMAQAVAACLGYEAFLQGAGIRVGMLVGVRTMQLHMPWLSVGDRLEITVTRTRGTDEVSTFEGTTHCEGRLASEASMTLFHAQKPPD